MIVKLSLIASIIFMGFNISDFFAGISKVEHKIKELKELVVLREATAEQLINSNTVLYIILSVVYLILLYAADFNYFVCGIIFVKLFISAILSYLQLKREMYASEISLKYYRLNKIDSLCNCIFAIFISIFLVL